MFMTLKRTWEALDGSKASKGEARVIIIPAGRHEIERVPNPYGHPAPWLVLKGTLIGAAEGSWRQWKNGGFTVSNPDHPDFGKPIDWDEWEVVIEE